MSKSDTPKLQNTPPLPDQDDESRRAHTAQRLRLLTGEWDDDVDQHRKKHFDAVKDSIQGPSDKSSNTLDTYTEELGKLYEEEPDATNDDPDAAQDYLDAVTAGGWWQLAQRNMKYVLGMNEMLVRPSLTEEYGYNFRLVTPNLVYAEAPPDDPDRPWYVVEARVREYPPGSGTMIWTWDVADVRTEPTFRVVIPRGNEPPVDITAEIHDGATFEGAGYPEGWKVDGRPVVPYVIYHRQRTGELWNAWDGREMVEGTLTVAVLWTFWQHAVRDSSWPQRYIAGGFIRGLSDGGEDQYSKHKSVTTDPASVLQIVQDGNDPVTIGQWQPGCDPKSLGEAIYAFELRLFHEYGMGADDFQRGGVESGYAIAMKRESVREAQRVLEPSFRRGDEQLLRLCASMWNAAGGSTPEDGYHVRYRSLPKTPQEITSQVEEHKAKIELGVESVVDVYLDDHPGMSREDAVKRLLEIQAEKRLLGAGMTPAPSQGGFGRE